MADGGLTLNIDEALADELRAAAAARGVSVEELARERLTSREWSADPDSEFAEDSLDWAEDYRRLKEYKRTGEAYDAEEVMKEFRERIAAGPRAKRR